MAIVEMSKLSIVGLNADKRAILNLLIKHGFVQIDDSSYLLEEEYGEILQRDSAESEVIQLEQKISLLAQCLESIKKYVTIKKPLFEPKREYQAVASEAEEDTLFANWGQSWWKIRDEIEQEMITENRYQGKKFHYLGGKGVKEFF